MGYAATVSPKEGGGGKGGGEGRKNNNNTSVGGETKAKPPPPTSVQPTTFLVMTEPKSLKRPPMTPVFMGDTV